MSSTKSNLTARNAPLPRVVVNMAMTADGKIATANRAVSSFGSARDQEHLYELRATADAVMAGARTVDLNRILMGPGPVRFRQQRRRRGLAEYHLRVIVSGAGSIDPRAAIFQKRFSPILILTTAAVSERRLKRLRAVADAVKICGDTALDFRGALAWLRDQWGVKRLLCEGGGELNGALFAQGLVEELHVTVCPAVFGGRAAPTLADGPGCATLAEAARLQLASAKRVGNELFLVYRTSRTGPRAAGSGTDRLCK